METAGSPQAFPFCWERVSKTLWPGGVRKCHVFVQGLKTHTPGWTYRNLKSLGREGEPWGVRPRCLRRGLCLPRLSWPSCAFPTTPGGRPFSSSSRWWRSHRRSSRQRSSRRSSSILPRNGKIPPWPRSPWSRSPRPGSPPPCCGEAEEGRRWRPPASLSPQASLWGTTQIFEQNIPPGEGKGLHALTEP